MSAHHPSLTPLNDFGNNIMARGINKAILVGNLGQDPELRYTGAGTAVCNMRLATNESYKDASGEWQERTEWHNLVAWGRSAENCNEYLRKGSQVYVEGSLQTRQWEDREGNTKYTTEIKVLVWMMLGGSGGGQSAQSSKAQTTQKKQSSAPRTDGGYTYEPDDDLPF